MTGETVLLIAVMLLLLVVFVFALFRMSAQNDRAARRAEKRLIPHSDVTVTAIDPGPHE